MAAIVPIFRKEEEKNRVHEFINKAMTGLLGPEEVEASENALKQPDPAAVLQSGHFPADCGR